MKDDPLEVMEAWRIALHILYVLCSLAIVAPVAALFTPVTRRWAKPERVTCPTCGYRLVAIERACPECRTAR
jgi:hypothetical protein